MSKSYHQTACFLSLLALGCGGSTEPQNSTRHFLLYTWQQSTTTAIVGEGVIVGGNYVKIDSAKVELRADGSVQESIWYVYAVPSTAAQVKTSESFQGRYVTVGNNTEIHLPLATDSDATVGYLQADQSLPLFRAWTRAGASFGGNFLYLKR